MRTNDQTRRRSDVHPTIRYGVAFVVGAVANFFGMCAAGAAGMFAIIMLPMVSGIVSGVCVLVFALLGRCLRFPALGRYWFGGFGPVACVLAIGLAFQVFGMSGRHLAPDSDAEEPTYRLGWSYWPGYVLLVFATTNFPYTRPRLYAATNVA